MDRWVSRELDVRFATVQGRGKTKRVIDLALDAFMRQKGSSAEQTKTLDPEFRRNAINNIKTFIFAGHDTSSSAICYCYYHLSRNSDSLAAIRKEHDDVFGHDTSSIAELIKKSPHLLNNLPYTSAVIKEVLRLQPPASSARQGEKGYAHWPSNCYGAHAHLVSLGSLLSTPRPMNAIRLKTYCFSL